MTGPGEIEDLELELANQLITFEGRDAGGFCLPPAIASRLSARELDEFHRANECLNLIQMASSVRDIESTLGDEPFEDWPTGLSFQYLTSLGGFEFIRELGRGGFGVVLLARDPRLQRNVAIKMPKPERFLDVESQKRFEREARAAAVLTHPAIVPIFESGRLGAFPYIAFEYCEGESLAELLNDQTGSMNPGLAAHVVKRLAEAVQYAHSRGVIHRDLKPANILVAHSPDRSPPENLDPCAFAARLRITDFGLARLEDDSDSLTHDGAIIGTPTYMAPELANGAAEATNSVDTYSLGVILYQILTGRVPFQGPTHLSTLALITETPAKSPRLVNAEIPQDLSAVCLKCLSKSPDERYASCQDFAEDLGRFLDGKPVLAREASAVEKTWRWGKRNPTLAIALTTLLVVLTSSTIVMTALWMNMNRAWRTSSFHERQSEARAQQALVQTQQLRSAIHQLLTAIANEPSIKSQDMEQFRKTLLVTATGFYHQLRNHVPDDDSLRLEYVATLASLAEIQQRLDDHQAAIGICREALGILGSIKQGQHLVLELELNQKLAFGLRAIGQDKEAEKIQQTAMNLAFASATNHPDSIATTLLLAKQINRQAAAYLLNKDFKNAEQSNDHAVALAESAFGNDLMNWPPSELAFEIVRTRADLLNRTGRSQSGLELAKLANDLFESIDCPDIAKSTPLLNSRASLSFVLGVAHSNAGNYPLAAQHFDEALATSAMLIDRHPEVGSYPQSRLSYQNSRALVHFLDDELAESESVLVTIIESVPELIARFPQSGNRIRFNQIKAQELLQAIFRNTNRPDQARQCLMSAIETCQDIIRKQDSTHELTSALGNLFYQLGRLDASLGHANVAKQNYLHSVATLSPIAEHQSAGEAVARLQNAYLGVMTASEATHDYQQAIAAADRFLQTVSRNDPRSDVVRRSYADWLARTHRFAQSLELIGELENRCNLPDDYYQLARTTAKCLGAIPILDNPGDPKTRLQIRSEYLAQTVELLRKSNPDGHSTTILDRVQKELDFEPVKSEESFQSLLATWMQE